MSFGHKFSVIRETPYVFGGMSDPQGVPDEPEPLEEVELAESLVW